MCEPCRMECITHWTEPLRRPCRTSLAFKDRYSRSCPMLTTGWVADHRGALVLENWVPIHNKPAIWRWFIQSIYGDFGNGLWNYMKLGLLHGPHYPKTIQKQCFPRPEWRNLSVIWGFPHFWKGDPRKRLKGGSVLQGRNQKLDVPGPGVIAQQGLTLWYIPSGNLT